MSNRTKIFSIGAIIISVFLALYFVEIKSKQDFAQEVDYYFDLASHKSDYFSVEFEDEVLDEHSPFMKEMYKMSRIELRKEFGRSLDNLYEQGGFKLHIKIDIANRVILLEDIGMQGYYQALDFGLTA